MTKEEIFNYFYTNSANLGVKSIILIMLAGLLVAFIIYGTYRFSYKGVAYNERFNISIIAVTLISIVIMLMISSNIVISLGMVGALSIVRFRTAIKDSRDTIFLFWAITEGLCVGSQNFKLAIITTLFIAIIVLVFSIFSQERNKYLFVISGSKFDYQEIIEVIRKHNYKFKIRTNNNDKEIQEFIVEIKTKGEINTNISDELLNIKNVENVNWVVESGETLG